MSRPSARRLLRFPWASSKLYRTIFDYKGAVRRSHRTIVLRDAPRRSLLDTLQVSELVEGAWETRWLQRRNGSRMRRRGSSEVESGSGRGVRRRLRAGVRAVGPGAR